MGKRYEQQVTEKEMQVALTLQKPAQTHIERKANF